MEQVTGIIKNIALVEKHHFGGTHSTFGMAFHAFIKFSQPVGGHFDIIIEQDDIFCIGCLDPFIAGNGKSHIIGELQQFYIGVLFFNHFAGTIGRAVIDHDDFVVFEIEFGKGVKTHANEPHSIPVGDYNADFQGGAFR